MVDKRGEDGILTPICHRRTWKQATHRDSDEDSASADDGYLLSNPRIQARGNDDDDGMKELGVQFVEFIKLKSSPRSTSPRDKDGRGKRQERRAEESQERRERQSRWRDDSSADDGRRKHSLRKRQGSSESRRDRQGDKSADNRRDKSPVDGHGKRTTARRRTAQRRLEQSHPVTRTQVTAQDGKVRRHVMCGDVSGEIRHMC